MPILDKKLFLADIEDALNEYVPANTVKRIIADAGEILTRYDVEHLPTDGSDPTKDESHQLIRLYVDAKAIEGKSPKTIERYKYLLEKLLEGTQVPFKKMTVYHLRQYIMAEKERGISMNTIKGNAYCWSGFFGWLRSEGIIDVDPTTNLGNIKAKPEEEPPFTQEQVHLLKEACETDAERAIIHFLLSTGCRVSELCAVNRDDVDYRNLCLTVTGKGDKERAVYIDDVTALMLKRYLAKRNDIDPALFRSRIGRYTPDGIRVLLNRIGDRACVPGVHPHRFRHTLATTLADRGMQVQEIAAILGHEKIDTTMVYVQVNQRNAENSYRRYACM